MATAVWPSELSAMLYIIRCYRLALRNTRHSHWSTGTTLKNVPTLTYYNLDIHYPITTIFGRSVTKKVRN